MAKADRIAAAIETRDAVREAARDAKRLSARLPKKDRKKLRSLVEKAKDVANVPEKRIERRPRRAKRKLDRVLADLVEAAGTTDAGTGAPRVESSGSPGTDLGDLTVRELRQRARDSGRTGYSRLTKAELVELLEP